MSLLVIIVIAFLSSALAARILMPWLLRLCHRHALTDENADKVRIPRVGGMVFAPALAFGLSLTLVVRAGHGSIDDTLKLSSALIALGTMFVFLLGVVDDIFGLCKWQKRLVLVATTMVFPICGLYVNNLHGILGIWEIGHWAGFFITMLLTALAVSGLAGLNDTDGLAGGFGLLVLMVFAIAFFRMGCHSYATMSVCMMGILVVFLYYNMFGDERIGTKTYMGHAGSLLMNYCIIYLALKYAMDNPRVVEEHDDALLLPYSLLAIPMLESLRVWLIKMCYGLSEKKCNQCRIQHMLRNRGFTERQATCLMLVPEVLLVLSNVLFFNLLYSSLTLIIVIDIFPYIAFVVFAKKASASRKRVATPPPLHFVGYKGQTGLVSVIMPTYNSERFLKESIESIQAQTYTEWELIIVDDCSTDGTWEIIESVAKADSRIKPTKNAENCGAGITRNKCITAAQGQFIAFCDSDDRWTPDKLEKQLEFMKAKNVALCFSPYYTCDERSQYLGYISAPLRVNLFEMMCDNKMGFLTCIYDTAQLGKHPMPGQRKRQDYAMLLNLMKVCRHAYSVQEPLAHYRLHTDSISSHKVSLLKYNAQTYTEVFGWPRPLSWLFLLLVFLPSYFCKRVKNVCITIWRTV